MVIALKNSVTLTFQPGVSAYTGCVDRWLGAGTSPSFSIKDPSWTAVRYTGDAQSWYLLRCDLSAIPAGAVVSSATLTFGSIVYSPSAVDAQRITDPDGLGSSFPTGWSTAGTSNQGTFYTGATSVFRNQTDVSTGLKWRNSDPIDGHSHIAGVLAPSEGPVSYQTGGPQSHVVTAAVQAWVNGAQNQGWAISAESPDANVQLFTVSDANIANRPILSVTFIPSGSDVTAPATITDLAVTSCTSQAPITCNLQWTAPGDNGMSGTATAYQILFGSSPITSTNVATADVFAGAPAPLPGGTLQTATVSGLQQGFRYSIAVRTRDASFNWAPPSNNVTVTTANPRGVSSTHPRILLTSGVPDTWNPNVDRLTAIRQRIQSGQAMVDFQAVQNLANAYEGSNIFDGADNSALLMPISFAFMYQMLKASNATAANTYADWVIDNFLLAAVWNDGGYDDTVAFRAEAAALVYDWCYDRIVSRNLQAQSIASLKAAYSLLATDVNYWQQSIRESDFHNYAVEIENSYIALGLALYGDDPAAATMLDRGWGMFAEGYPFQPTSFGDTVTFKLKNSIDTLTGGALNWEGPVYWRASAPEILRGIEAYDTATRRAGNVWTNLFSNTVNAGYYKIYMLQPDGANPGMGDASEDTPTAGRDNFGMVILLDRFKDGYIKQFVDTAVADPWDAGQGGSIGLIWKLMFYDYANQVPAKPYSSLPTSREFGRDVVMRTGWGPSDTYMTFSAGYTGVYHNHLDQGNFTIFKNSQLTGTGGAYTTAVGPYYYDYFKKSVSSNVPLIYDSTECWRDNSTTCSIANDGGQRWPWRRFSPPYSTNTFGVNRLWSGTVLSDPSYSEQFLAATKTSTLNRASGTIDYVSADLTKAYANAYSNANGDPANTNTNARVSQVTRDLVFVKPNYVVMFDRISATGAGLTKSLPIHTFSAPVMGGVSAQPGIGTYPSTVMQSDHGTGRLFVQPLLPKNSNVRVVGGNTCTTVNVTTCSNTNPTVCTTDQPHNLTEGEIFGMQDGPNIWGSWAGAVNTDAMGASTAHVISATTFTPMDMNGNPVNGSNLGAFPAGYQMTYHANCGYEGYVDNYLGHPANLWWPANNAAAVAATPRWRAEVQAPLGSLTDYFLNVLYPTTTNTAAMPTSTLIESATYYGALILDNTAPQVVLFSKSSVRQTAASYTASYTGSAQHVLTGLAPGNYVVLLNGSPLSTIAVGTDGMMNFTANGGGTFSVSLQ